jgi:hypothetical protein
MQVLVDQLRQKCLEEPRSEDRPRAYSALTQDHKTEWQQEVGGLGPVSFGSALRLAALLGAGGGAGAAAAGALQ